jgi:hypothetical protein
VLYRSSHLHPRKFHIFIEFCQDIAGALGSSLIVLLLVSLSLKIKQRIPARLQAFNTCHNLIKDEEDSALFGILLKLLERKTSDKTTNLASIRTRVASIAKSPAACSATRVSIEIVNCE